MDRKEKCGICGRLFKVTDFEIMLKQFSRVRIHAQDHNYTIGECDYDTCPACALKVLHFVEKMKREAPRKCDWCEHDYGPKHPKYRKGCEDCSRYSNFKLKKRLSEREKYMWDVYNGERPGRLT